MKSIFLGPGWEKTPPHSDPTREPAQCQCWGYTTCTQLLSGGLAKFSAEPVLGSFPRFKAEREEAWVGAWIYEKHPVVSALPTCYAFSPVVLEQ